MISNKKRNSIYLVVRRQKLDLKQKYVILLLRKVILLFKGSFKRGEIIFEKKIICERKIILLKFFPIASSQIFENGAILINNGSFFQGEDFLQLECFQFIKSINYYQIQQFVYKHFILENCFLMILAVKEFIFKNGKSSRCKESFPRKND